MTGSSDSALHFRAHMTFGGGMIRTSAVWRRFMAVCRSQTSFMGLGSPGL